MNIRFEDLRHEAQMEIWDEIRSYLLWTEQIEPMRPGEGFAAFEHRINQSVQDFLDTSNYLASYDVCQTTS